MLAFEGDVAKDQLVPTLIFDGSRSAGATAAAVGRRHTTIGRQRTGSGHRFIRRKWRPWAPSLAGGKNLRKAA